MAVVMEVADQGDIDPHHLQLLHDPRDGRGRLGIVDGQPHHLRACTPQFGHLLHAGGDIGGVGVGHRLHHHGMAPAHDHAADMDGIGLAAGPHGGVGGLGRSGHGVMHRPILARPAHG
ncbi:hypothetical protein D3C71_1673490 [compost metagenome]